MLGFPSKYASVIKNFWLGNFFEILSQISDRDGLVVRTISYRFVATRLVN